MHPSFLSLKAYPAPELTSKIHGFFFFFLLTMVTETIKFSFPSGSSWSKRIQQFQTPGRQTLKS